MEIHPKKRYFSLDQNGGLTNRQHPQSRAAIMARKFRDIQKPVTVLICIFLAKSLFIVLCGAVVVAILCYFWYYLTLCGTLCKIFIDLIFDYEEEKCFT